MVVAGYWSVFDDGAVAQAKGSTYVTVTNELTQAWDAIVESVATKSGAIYADAYTPFKSVGDDTGLLADDGDHPNALGHALLSTAVVQTWSSAIAIP